MADDKLVTIETAWKHDGIIDTLLTNGCSENVQNNGCHEDHEDGDDLSELLPFVLSKPDGDTDCCLSIRSCSGRQVIINTIEIMSNMKTIEVYDHTDGYLFCMRGKSLTILTETVFRCSTILDRSCDNVYFKFPVKSNIDTMTLFRLKLDVSLSTQSLQTLGQGTTIDLEKVKGYLGEIPENAKSLYKNMEAYQQNQKSMKAAMMTGSNMGSFGMMGLMSALMGNLNMQSHVGHLDHTSSKIVNKTNSQEPEITGTDNKVVQESGTDNKEVQEKVDTHIKSSQEQCPDNLENSDDTKETKKLGQLPGSDILTSLMNGTETGQGGMGMFSVLKDICSKVSSERNTVNVSEGGKHKEEKRNEMVTNQDENVRRIVEEELQKTEERLKVYVEKQMSSLEERLNEKLDNILTCISKMDNTHPP